MSRLELESKKASIMVIVFFLGWVESSRLTLIQTGAGQPSQSNKEGVGGVFWERVDTPVGAQFSSDIIPFLLPLFVFPRSGAWEREFFRTLRFEKRLPPGGSEDPHTLTKTFLDPKSTCQIKQMGESYSIAHAEVEASGGSHQTRAVDFLYRKKHEGSGVKRVPVDKLPNVFYVAGGVEGEETNILRVVSIDDSHGSFGTYIYSDTERSHKIAAYPSSSLRRLSRLRNKGRKQASLFSTNGLNFSDW